MCTEYLRTLPLINKIDDMSNKLILSKISKADAYAFASELQDVLDSLAEACVKYYSQRPPEFQNRNYIEMREVFVGPAIINVEHNFEDLLQHKNDNTLTNVSLTDCRVPTNFGVLETYKKSLATFLLNLSRHKDDPVVSVSKKLENRSG